MSRNRTALLALIACVLSALPFGAGAQTLKIATIAPDGTSWMAEMRNGAKQIAARTEGRVKFKFYPGGVMGNDAIVLRKIRITQLHGGAIMGGGLAAIYPDANIYSLPFAFRSYGEVDYVRRRMDALIREGLKERGFVSFGLAEAGFSHMMSNRPIRTVGDLKGQKVWVPLGDRVGTAALKALKVSPIPLPLTDVLTALQTGLVDTVMSSPIGHIALQWHTRVKYLTDIPLLYLYGVLVIERGAFERLRPGDQAIVREVMEGVYSKIGRRNREGNESARQALRRQGIVFVTVSQKNWEQWRQSLTKTVNRLSQQGIFTAAMLKILEGHLNDYRRIALKSK